MRTNDDHVLDSSTEAKVQFMGRAEELWKGFNDWYKANPEAAFDEIDEEMGKRRREVVGSLSNWGCAKAIWAPKRSHPVVRDAGSPWLLEDTQERQSTAWTWASRFLGRTIAALPGRQFFSSLDRRLRLRRDGWSGGFVREAAHAACRRRGCHTACLLARVARVRLGSPGQSLELLQESGCIHRGLLYDGSRFRSNVLSRRVLPREPGQFLDPADFDATRLCPCWG